MINIPLKRKITAFLTLTLYLLFLGTPLWCQPKHVSLPPPVYFSSPPIIPSRTPEPVFSYPVTPEKSHKIHYQGVTLTIPAGAVDKETILTIEKLKRVNPLNEGIKNVTAQTAGYRFGPHPFQFNKNISVSLNYDEKVNQSQSNLADLAIWFYNEALKTWESLPVTSIDRERSSITVLTRHFTDMITGTLSLPEMPGILNFDPNSIKNLESVMPDLGVPSIQGLTGQAMGGASFSLPLTLPPGRGKTSPRLDLTYNINSSNSWLGRGFDISVPAVTTDTRFGVPLYNGHDSYMLAGEALVLEKDLGNGKEEYRLRIEADFMRIWHIRDSRDSRGPDYWMVTNKEGTTQYFGGNDATSGPDPTRVFIWHLQETCDSNGNRIHYAYEQDSNHLYLKNINWSGHGFNKGPYDVSFNRTPRNDIRTNGRGKYFDSLGSLLERIDISYEKEIFRSYEFDYEQNMFEQNQLIRFSEKNGSGELFYAYQFDYEQAQKEEQGYTGFIMDEWETDSGPWADSQSSSSNFSLGLTIGFQGWSFYWLGAKKEWLWQLGFHAGGGASQSWQTKDLMDLNGDGLPDLIYQQGESLTGRLNRVNHFGEKFTFAGFDCVLNNSTQTHHTLGGSAGLGPATLSITYQDSHSSQNNTLQDVNGDGFLDVVMENSETYLKNRNRVAASDYRFEKEEWQDFSTDSRNYLPQPEMSEEDRDNYQRSYYIETPVLRWKAYKPGIVRATHNVGLAHSDQQSPDGVGIIMDYSDGEIRSLHIDSAVNKESSHQVMVDQDQVFYFLLDPKEDIIGQEKDLQFKDCLFWSTSVEYESIAWFAHANQKQALFDIPLINKADLKRAALEGRFVPNILTTPDFDTLYQFENPLQDYNQKAILQTLYIYDSSANQFLLREGVKEDPRALELLRSALYDRLPRCFAPFDLLRLAFQTFDGEEIIFLNQESEQMIFSYERNIPGDKALHEEGNIYLDRIYNNESGNDSYFDYYLDLEDKAISLINETGQVADRINPVLYETLPNSPEDRGYLIFSHEDTRFIYQIEWANIPHRVDRNLFQERVYPLIMKQEEFRLFPHEELTMDFYNELSEKPDIIPLLENLYQKTDETYRLIPGLKNEGTDFLKDYQTLVNEIDRVKIIIKDSVFSEYNLGPSEKRVVGFIRLTPLERDFLIHVGGLTPENFLEENDTILIDPHINTEIREKAAASLSLYRAYEELFPYYSEEADSFTLASESLTLGEISDISELFQELDLKSPEKIHVSYLYEDEHLFTVHEEIAPQSLQTLPVNSLDSTPPQVGADETYPGFSLIRTQGDRSYKKCFPLHDFNSTKDYSLEDRRGAYLKNRGENPLFELPPQSESDPSLIPLKPYLEQIVRENTSDNSFAGGFRNWSYGFFSLYHEYEWDSRRIGQDDYEQSTYRSLEEVDQKGSQVVKPPYLTAAKKSESSWTGTVSDYTQTETKLINNQVETVHINYRFAPSITDKSIWQPMRKGGLTYYHSQAYQKKSVPPSENAGFLLGDFQQSASTGMTYSGGISLGFAGVNGGYTDSTARGIRTFRDINGDSYPDIITANSEDLTVLLGGHRGFSRGQTYPGGFGTINETQNTTITAGASVVPGGKLEDLIYSPESVPIATVVLANYEGGVIGSAGINATETSTNSQIDLIDINGDGLPDHLKSRNGGDYEVRLNMGDRFITQPDWLNSTGHDLAHHVTGALGASLSGGIGVTGLSGGINGSVNKTEFQLIDMNGDGLPDQVEKKSDESFFRVHFNRGSSFTTEKRINCPPWHYDIDKYLAQMAEDMTSMTGININNMDLVTNLGSVVDLSAIQSQNPLAAAASPFAIHDTISSTTGTTLSLGAGLTISISYLLMVFSISPGISGTRAESKTSLSMRDINGDGCPDHIFRDPAASRLNIRVNQLSRVGLLKAINLPQGGRYELTYGLSTNTMQDPHTRRNLTGLTRKDNEQGTSENIHTYHVTYAYEKGCYNRQEREFQGYQKVITLQADGSRRETNYSNQTYALKGKPTARTSYDTEEEEFQRTDYYYQTRLSPSGLSLFVYTCEEKETLTDKRTKNTMESRKIFDYDKYGNLIDLISEITGEPDNQNYHLKLEYFRNETNWIMGLPDKLEAHEGTGIGTDQLLRKRTARYDNRGNLIELNQYYGQDYDQVSSTRMTYDDYGNRLSLKDPGGYQINYDYGTHHQYHEKIYDKDYTSFLVWDKRYALETGRTEINGHRVTMSYDRFGRIIEIRTPYDTGPVPAVQYSYDHTQYPWRSIISQKISHNPQNEETLDTVNTLDGLGRLSQSAREGVVTNEKKQKERGWIRSGPLWYDIMERPIAEGQPQFQKQGYTLPLMTYPTPAPMQGVTQKSYDTQGRINLIEMVDKSIITTDYAISKVSHHVAKPYYDSSQNVALMTLTDPLGNITEIEKNGRGHIIGMIKKNSQGKVLTAMSYSLNSLGELLGCRDMKGNQINYRYDKMGRTIVQESTHGGKQEYYYNEAGNLTGKQDSKLRDKGKIISYEYDSRNRLIKVDYPFSEDIIYQYGTTNNHNSLGRLKKESQGTTSTLYEYGKLGETTAQTRTIARQTAHRPEETARMEYTLNYLGQWEEVTYPDQEKLTYSYDQGGQIIRAVGNRLSQSFPYIEDMGYDEYGQRVYIKYNNRNGMETTYEYHSDRRWLNHVETINPQRNQTSQNIDYTYDKAGNLLTVNNIKNIHHSTYQNYNYNDLYQLTEAQGSYQLHRNSNMITFSSKYTQTFTYDNIDNMTGMTSSEQQNPPAGMTPLDYNKTIQYYPGYPHRAEKIGNIYYSYDVNGNTTEERLGGHRPQDQTAQAQYTQLNDTVNMASQPWAWYRTQTEQDSTYSRQYHWDEENRLTGTSDPSYNVSYTYDPQGQRTGKNSQLGETLYFNSLWTSSNTGTSGELRRTKNIYVGDTCLASKMNYNESSLDYEKTHIYYYHTDILKSSNVISDHEGEIYDHWEYTPYGETWIHDQNTQALEQTALDYTAQEKDRETGFYHMKSRYMNPPTARWISPDPAAFQLINPAQENKINQNPYAYVSHNPLKYRDPTGLIEEGISDILNAHNQWLQRAHQKERKEYTYEELINTAEKAGLMGKLYETGFLCDDFGEALFKAMGIDKSEYLPKGAESLVTTNMDTLTKDRKLQNNPVPGWNVFYKRMDNGKDGHFGFVYMSDNGTHTFLHNGLAKEGLDRVNIYIRKGHNPDLFFKQDDYSLQYIPLRG